MKIVQWNATKKKQPMTGVKRYEDELFRNLKKLLRREDDWKVERIQSSNNRVTGNTFISWLLRYRCKDADIVHATEETVAPVVNFRRPKKFLVTSHGLIPISYPSTIKDITTKIQWMLIPKALAKADRIIAISQFTKKETIRITGTEESKIEVVHHGVDHSKYHPMNKEICKKEFNLGTAEKHILVVSSNLEQKRMDIVERVFKQIRNIKKDVKLLKAGYGEVFKGDGVINVGWASEDKMPMLFNAADVYLHPSEYESFGLPILEAMACGVPVVTSNRASIPEVVGPYGAMIDLKSKNVIDHFMDKILENIDKGIDEKAIEWSKNFSWKKTAKKTIKIYKKLGE